MNDMSWAVSSGIIAGGALVAMFLGLPIVQGMLRLIDRMQAHQEELPGWDPQPEAPRRSVLASVRRLSGGAWIGMLERLAIYATILAGFPAGIAVVLGIKGLARYPELQNPDADAAQGFIIGTFLSVLFSTGCAGVAWWILQLVP